MKNQAVDPYFAEHALALFAAVDLLPEPTRDDARGTLVSLCANAGVLDDLEWRRHGHRRYVAVQARLLSLVEREDRKYHSAPCVLDVREDGAGSRPSRSRRGKPSKAP